MLSIAFFIIIYVVSNVTFLSLIGFYAMHYWCIENFDSIIRIGIHLFGKCLRPSEYLSLKQRFGDWAGLFGDFIQKQTQMIFVRWFFVFSIIFLGWKVVTGATDGIGREYVNQLASQGINIVLVSRSYPKLAKIASEIGIIDLILGARAKKFQRFSISNRINVWRGHEMHCGGF